jgi:nucleoside-diphosphate-sugar epimerase
MESRKILITGATGFVGSNLARRFLKEGMEVHVLTRHSSDKWRIVGILGDIREHSADLLQQGKLESIVSVVKPNIIVHSAVYGGHSFQKEARQIMDSNFFGTFNLLNACRKSNFDLFINTGSSSEYGAKPRPMKESDVLEPLDSYGVSKTAATLYAQSLAKTMLLPICTLRLFSPYGYYDDPKRLVSSTTISCLKGEKPNVSSPDPVRDFIFIEDVADAYMKAIETPGAIGKILNIGSGKQYSVDEVVGKIIELTGGKVRPVWGGAQKRSGEPAVWQADVSLAKAVLNWEPIHSLEGGLSKTAKWFMENMNLYENLRG